MSVFKNITFGFLFLTVSFVTNAQNFQKVYPLNGRLSLFNAIKVETSEYLLTGSLGPINSNQVLGSVVKLSSEGDVDLIEIIGDSNEIHFLGFSHADILRIDDSSSICWHIVSKPNQLSSEYIFHINSDGESTWSSLDTAWVTGACVAAAWVTPVWGSMKES